MPCFLPREDGPVSFVFIKGTHFAVFYTNIFHLTGFFGDFSVASIGFSFGLGNSHRVGCSASFFGEVSSLMFEFTSRTGGDIAL